jgi:hypothetical protein
VIAAEARALKVKEGLPLGWRALERFPIGLNHFFAVMPALVARLSGSILVDAVHDMDSSEF